MKVIQKSEFKPITIEVETKNEADIFLALFLLVKLDKLHTHPLGRDFLNKQQIKFYEMQDEYRSVYTESEIF